MNDTQNNENNRLFVALNGLLLQTMSLRKYAKSSEEVEEGATRAGASQFHRWFSETPEEKEGGEAREGKVKRARDTLGLSAVVLSGPRTNHEMGADEADDDPEGLEVGDGQNLTLSTSKEAMKMDGTTTNDDDGAVKASRSPAPSHPPPLHHHHDLPPQHSNRFTPFLIDNILRRRRRGGGGGGEGEDDREEEGSDDVAGAGFVDEPAASTPAAAAAIAAKAAAYPRLQNSAAPAVFGGAAPCSSPAAAGRGQIQR